MHASNAPAGHAGILGIGTPVLELLRRGRSALLLRHRRRRAVAALEALSDRSLQDMGVTRSEIEAVVDAHLRGASRPAG